MIAHLVTGNPLKLIVKLKGEIEITLPSVAGIYIRQNASRDFSHWLQENKWRQDRRCGKDYPLPDGKPAQCNPEGPLGPKQAGPCCSEYGYCGGSSAHCECANCIDYRTVGRTFKNVICAIISVRLYNFKNGGS